MKEIVDIPNSPKVPAWMVEEAEKWRRLVAAGIFVYAPMTEAELLEEDPDHLAGEEA